MAELDTKRIAAAALAILDANGIPGFTVRAVADKLGVTPMALYHYVPDKAGLATLVVDTAVREHSPAPLTGSWRVDLLADAYWIRKSALAHPAVTELQQMYRVWSPVMLHFAERWVVLWQQSGLPREQALLAAKTTALAMSGLAVLGVRNSDFQPPDDEMLKLMPNARLLFTTNPDPDEMFELSVRSIIDGIHAKLLEEPAPTTRSPRMKTRTATAKQAARHAKRASR